MFPGEIAPTFGNHQESVTRLAADKLAECFSSMVKRGVPRDLSQRFILQLLVSLFAQDIGLLEKYSVTKTLRDCKGPQDTYDLLGSLFTEMNSKGVTKGGRFAGTQYFNGGLFRDPARVELKASERTLLQDASDFKWSNVRPEIFGTIFEHSLEAEKRHAFGAHFTNTIDIMKIIGPTIVEPWRTAISKASTLKDLQALQSRIENYTVLDPACGSGNFLYLAYRELKRLEADLYAKIVSDFPKSADTRQRQFGFVSASNFFGIDSNPFAIELAKVTMSLAHKLAIDELHINESALPLDNLDSNFIAGDALITRDGSQQKWFKIDVIIGNPPFLGAKRFKEEHSSSYVNLVRRAYPAVPGMADLCVYWFSRAADELPPCTDTDPVRGRAGLVGTQNIRNNASRIGGLDKIVVGGTIVDAVENQPWSGDAKVNVSIVNWVKSTSPRIVGRRRRLWTEVISTRRLQKGSAKAQGSGVREANLAFRDVDLITSSLSDRIDVSGAHPLLTNKSPQRAFQGVTPGYAGLCYRRQLAAVFQKALSSSVHI